MHMLIAQPPCGRVNVNVNVNVNANVNANVKLNSMTHKQIFKFHCNILCQEKSVRECTHMYVYECSLYAIYIYIRNTILYMYM